MCNLILDRGNFTDFTSVSNVFIDEYMPKANGEFIKIYLHLLRLVNGGDHSQAQELSTEKIADKFNVLESDVIRALNYWAEQGLISLSFNNNNQIAEIKLESVLHRRYFVKGIGQNDSLQKQNTLATAAGEVLSSAVPESTGIIVPAKKKYSAKEISAFTGDDRVTQLTFLAQTYLGKTLNSTDINSILYMLEGLGFGTDFIEYIMETCISSGHKTLSYIEKQAVEYARRGIVTVEDAKIHEKLKSDIYKSIYKIFGLTPKAPIKKEIDYITKWTDRYGFSDEIILEACNRTMEHTHTGSFQYADTILSNWFRCNAKTMDIIKELDAAHSEEVTASLKTKPSTRKKKAKTFDQRTYDYDELERQLIANRNRKLKKYHSDSNC